MQAILRRDGLWLKNCLKLELTLLIQNKKYFNIHTKWLNDFKKEFLENFKQREPKKIIKKTEAKVLRRIDDLAE